MRAMILLVAVANLSGCGAVLRALDIGPSDIAPSLKYCSKVSYERNDTKVRILAECNAPIGTL